MSPKLAANIEKSLFVTLILTFFVIPFSIAAVEIFRALSIVLFILLLVCGKGRYFKKDNLDILVGLYLLVALISVFYSPYLKQSWRAFLGKALNGVAIYFVARNFFFQNRGKSKYLIMTVITAAAIVSLDGFYQYLFGQDLFRGFKPDVFFEGSATLMTKRITACMKYPTDLAAYLTFALPFSLVAFMKSKNMLPKVFSGSITLLLSVAIMLTYARSSWLTVFLVFLIFTFLLKKKIVLVWLLPFILFLLFAPRTATLFRTIQPQTFIDGSLQDRITYSKDALELISRNIFLGNGINTYDRLNKELHPGREKYAYAHNCYLQMWAELGLIGLGLFLSFIILLFRRILLTIKREGANIWAKDQGAVLVCMFMGLVILTISFIFDTHFYNTPLSVLFWYTCGVIAALTL